MTVLNAVDIWRLWTFTEDQTVFHFIKHVSHQDPWILVSVSLNVISTNSCLNHTNICCEDINSVYNDWSVLPASLGGFWCHCRQIPPPLSVASGQLNKINKSLHKSNSDFLLLSLHENYFCPVNVCWQSAWWKHFGRRCPFSTSGAAADRQRRLSRSQSQCGLNVSVPLTHSSCLFYWGGFPVSISGPDQVYCNSHKSKRLFS